MEKKIKRTITNKTTEVIAFLPDGTEKAFSLTGHLPLNGVSKAVFELVPHATGYKITGQTETSTLYEMTVSDFVRYARPVVKPNN